MVPTPQKNVNMNYRAPGCGMSCPFFCPRAYDKAIQIFYSEAGQTGETTKPPPQRRIAARACFLGVIPLHMYPANIFTKTPSPQWLPGRTPSYPVLASMHKHTRGRWSPYWQIQFRSNLSPRVVQTLQRTAAWRVSPYQSRVFARQRFSMKWAFPWWLCCVDWC